MTEIIPPNSGSDLFEKWKILNNNLKKMKAKSENFWNQQKTTSPTGYSGATSLPAIGRFSIYIERSSNNHGNKVFVSFERTDIIQISNISFYYNRFTILTNDSIKSMRCFRIHLLLEDKTWSTRCNIPKDDRYSDLSTDWTKLSLMFTVENYGIKLTITHSVY